MKTSRREVPVRGFGLRGVKGSDSGSGSLGAGAGLLDGVFLIFSGLGVKRSRGSDSGSDMSVYKKFLVSCKDERDLNYILSHASHTRRNDHLASPHHASWLSTYSVLYDIQLVHHDEQKRGIVYCCLYHMLKPLVTLLCYLLSMICKTCQDLAKTRETRHLLIQKACGISRCPCTTRTDPGSASNARNRTSLCSPTQSSSSAKYMNRRCLCASNRATSRS